MMVGPAQLLVIPRRLAHKALQAADLAPLYVAGHRLNGFAGQRTTLADHIVLKVAPRFAAGKAIMKEALELLEFLQKPCHIGRMQVKRRNRKRLTFKTAAR